MTISVAALLQDVKDAIEDRKAYLYGSAIRQILSGESPDVFDVFIRHHHAEPLEKITSKLPQSKHIRYSFGTSFSVNARFTIDTLYVDLEDLLKGNIEVQSFQNGLKDYNKNSIKFTKDSLADLQPQVILDAISLSVETGFHLDPKTITEICNNVEKVNTLPKRAVYKELANALKSKRTRKIISFWNTLGVAKALFGYELAETSIVNHLRSSDILEFFTIIFNNVPLNELKEVLVDRCGFFERDIGHVINLATALNQVWMREDEADARRFLTFVGKDRITNVVRLLKYLNYKELAKNIKKQKGASVTLSDLCIDASLIQVAFGIDNEELVAILLQKALEKVIAEPEFNNQTKILTYLNSERKKLNAS
jgi:tRNA nucleotidyltransferase/poly(A) polymerase